MLKATAYINTYSNVSKHSAIDQFLLTTIVISEAVYAAIHLYPLFYLYVNPSSECFY